MLKAVIFDIDNTLYDYDAVNEKAITYAGDWFCEELNISYEKFFNAFAKSRLLTKTELAGCASQHNRIIYFQKTSELLGVNPIEYSLELYEKYWGYILDNMQLENGTGRLFERLKHSGIKIAVCTDLTTHIQHRKLRKLGIADYIDVFVSSEEAGVEKPDIRIFDLVVNKLGIYPNEALHIGDSYEKDVAGAAGAGIYPVWFNRYNSRSRRMKIVDCLKITEMVQLERYIYDIYNEKADDEE